MVAPGRQRQQPQHRGIVMSRPKSAMTTGNALPQPDMHKTIDIDGAPVTFDPDILHTREAADGRRVRPRPRQSCQAIKC